VEKFVYVRMTYVYEAWEIERMLGLRRKGEHVDVQLYL
jgi:hypothetical protein